MSDSHINYRENYFQHPSLTKISGDPTYSSLAKLERECKANGKSVSSTLGGGLQGHLGLVCSPAAYNRVSPGVPYDRPALPILQDLTGLTGAQIAEARQTYADDIVTFQACNLIERTIVQQINTALDQDCLADLIDDDTGLLEGTVPEILQTLFDTYGDITPQSLAAAKSKVESITYNHARPIVNIFTAINEYANMAEAANAAETTSQLINIGIIVITRSTIFASDVRKWHAKPEADKTWPSFKDHFKRAQKDIKKSQPTITADSLGFHEVNNASAIADQVIDRLTIQQDEATTITAESLAEHQMEQQLANMANSTQQNSQMIEQMTALATTISTLQAQVNSNQSRGRSSGGGGGRGGGRGRSSGRGRGAGPRSPPRYCWTHGNCAHGSAECSTKAAGHIDDANYTNMQGGSVNRCHWLT
jgi:hypothetical protein